MKDSEEILEECIIYLPFKNLKIKKFKTSEEILNEDFFSKYRKEVKEYIEDIDPLYFKLFIFDKKEKQKGSFLSKMKEH